MPKVDITIRRKRPSPEPDEPPKGIIPPGKPPDYWPRRLQRGRYFDLGQIRDGSSWITNDYAFIPNFIVVEGVGYFAEVGQDHIATDVAPALADIQVLEAEILATGVENFANLYRRVPEEQLELDIFFGSFVERQFVPMELGPRFRTKITTTPDYAASEVHITVESNDKVFFMPAINRNVGYSKTRHDGAPTYYEDITLNHIYRLRPRDWEEVDPIYTAAGDTNPVGFVEALARTLAISPSRTATLKHTYSDSSPYEFTPAGTFPVVIDDQSYSTLPFVKFDFQSYIGQLTGVVKHSGTYYYFWRSSL